MTNLKPNTEHQLLLILVTEINPRTLYIMDFVFEQVLRCKYELTTDIQKFKNSNTAKINYTAQPINNAIQIVPANIIFQEKIIMQEIDIIDWQGHKAFFKTSQGQIPFDVFGASFYLISRYEEYLTEEKDEYERYPHTASIAFKNNFLQLPLVDNWLYELKKIILQNFPSFAFQQKQFQFTPTYDIDIAYSYKHKGFIRNIAGGIIDLTRGVFFTKRLKVLLGLEKDPYDAYDFLDSIHEQYNLKPIYFFLLGSGSKLDKNLNPRNDNFRNLIKNTAAKYEVGIHPSYQSNLSARELKDEINTLRTLINEENIYSRQHYIKFSLPNTYEILINNKVTADYSMGYGSINGFRASTSHPFLWFNLSTNEATKLLIHPFCFMECNSFFEQKQNIQQTRNEIDHYIEVVKNVEGNFISVWHNFSLGTDKLWTGWKELYLEMIEKIKKE